MAKNIRGNIIAGQKTRRQKETEAAAKKKGTYKKNPAVKTEGGKAPKWDGKHAGFISMETYGRAMASNAKGLKEGTAQTYGAILKEVERDPEYSQHVDPDLTALEPPELLYGNLTHEIPKNAPKALKMALTAYQSDPSAETFAAALEQTLDQRYKNAKVSARQRVRVAGEKDVFGKPAYRYEDKQQPVKQSDHVLLAGVVSLPESLKDLQDEWIDRTLKFLKNEYGNSLKGAILHTDESNPHIHYYVTPDGPNPLSNRVHPGLAAKLALKNSLNQQNEANWNKYQSQLKAWDDNGRTGRQPRKPKTLKAEPPENKAAYAAGMSEFQDRFFHAVSEPLGMKRKADRQYKRQQNRQRYMLQKWTSSLNAGLDNWEQKANASHLYHSQKIQEKLNELTSLTTGLPKARFGNYKASHAELAERMKKINHLTRLMKKHNDIHVSKLKNISAKRAAVDNQYRKTLNNIESGKPWANEYKNYKQKIEKQVEDEMKTGKLASDYLWKQFNTPDFDLNEYESITNAGKNIIRVLRNVEFKEAQKQRRWEKVRERMLSPSPLPPWHQDELAQLISEELAEALTKLFERLNELVTGHKPKTIENEISDLEKRTLEMAEKQGLEI